MNETSEQWAAEIEASLNSIPFDNPEIGDRLAASGLTGTCQFILTGLGSWLGTFKDGAHTTVRCDGACDPPPDATITMTPETYLRILRREDRLDAEAALHQGLITIDGDFSLAIQLVAGSV